jgi:hypothetical protein
MQGKYFMLKMFMLDFLKSMVRPIGRFRLIRPDAVHGISFGFVHEERMGKTRDNGHDFLTTKGFLTYHQKGRVIESPGVSVFFNGCPTQRFEGCKHPHILMKQVIQGE